MTDVGLIFRFVYSLARTRKTHIKQYIYLSYEIVFTLELSVCMDNGFEIV